MLYQGMQEQYGLLFWMNELFPILSGSRLSWDANLVAVEVVGFHGGLGIVETGDVFQRVGMGQQVARFVVGITVITAFGIAFTDQTVVVVIVEMQNDAVRTGNTFHLAFVAVLITGNASHCIGMAEQTAQVVAFHQVGAAVGKHPFGQLIVVVVMILLGTAQYVGYLRVTFVIGKTPFRAQ